MLGLMVDMYCSVDVDVDVVLLETARCHIVTFMLTPCEIDESSMRKSTCKIPSAVEWKANYDNDGLCAIKNANVNTLLSQKETPMALAYNTYKMFDKMIFCI